MLRRVVRILVITFLLTFILSQCFDLSLAAPRCCINWAPTCLSLSATTNSIPWSVYGRVCLLGTSRFNFHVPRFEPSPVWSGGAFRWHLVLPWWLLYSIPGIPLFALWLLTRRGTSQRAFPVILAVPSNWPPATV